MERLFSEREYKYHEEPLHYNDAILSQKYSPKYVKRHWWHVFRYDDQPVFDVGRECVKCLACGEHYITDASTMVCEGCYTDEDKVYCELCGCALHPDNDETYRLHDGSPCCYDCAVDYTTMCAHCGELYMNADLNYIEKTDEYVCNNCKIDYLKAKENEQNGC